MSNVWDPATPKPLPKTRELLRTQMPNAPEKLVEESLDELAARPAGEASPAAMAPTPAPDDVLTKLATAEAAAADAKAQVAAAIQQVTALTAQVEAMQAALAKATSAPPSGNPPVQDQLDATGRALVDVQGQITKLQADVTKLEAARPTAAPARAAAPAARPAASA